MSEGERTQLFPASMPKRRAIVFHVLKGRGEPSRIRLDLHAPPRQGTFLLERMSRTGNRRCVQPRTARCRSILQKKRSRRKKRDERWGAPLSLSVVSQGFRGSFPLLIAYLLGRHGRADGHGDARADGADGAVDGRELLKEKGSDGRSICCFSIRLACRMFLSSLSRAPENKLLVFNSLCREGGARGLGEGGHRFVGLRRRNKEEEGKKEGRKD